MSIATRLTRPAPWLLAAAAAGALLLGGSAVQEILPGAMASTNIITDAEGVTTTVSADAVADICAVSYDALDAETQTVANPNKETPGAVGTPVTQRDEAGIKAELQERRTCGTDGKFDLELTASHYADWSAKDLTSRTVEYADIDAFRAELNANPDLYASIQQELTDLENASAFATEATPAGVWSVYVLPTGNGDLTTHIGRTSRDGTSAVFTHPSGAVVKYRLECGFQIIHDSPPVGIDVCEYDECNAPPAVTPPVETPPVVTPPTTPPVVTPPTPTCPPETPHGTWPVCKDEPTNEPEAPTGGGPNEDPGPGPEQPEPTQPPEEPYVPPTPPVTPPTEEPTPEPTPTPTPTEDPEPTPTPEPTEEPTPVCPPGQTGTPPVCKDLPTNDPAPTGNAPVGGGLNEDPGPGVEQPVAPTQPPEEPYVAPLPPVVGTVPEPTTGPVEDNTDPEPEPEPETVQTPIVEPAPVPTADPAPAPAPEVSTPTPEAPEVVTAPTPEDPAEGTSCAPGITDC